MVDKKTGKRIFSSKDEVIRDLSENFAPIELFFHQLNLEIEKLLKEPTEGRINKVLKLIACKDSHAYMLYPKWYADKNIAKINDYLASIKERNAIN
ncbi:TPA: hypothetical protein J0T96_001289 [Enterococcus faecium]|uniref:hypothetical protein n=1 Tax=Enterococcus faecium TaxID=1352 RepID=UPI00223629B0|nr:hypothetical protein [Enterococcus faecium]HAZ0860387.1 hypothetical protein [Enterococcus faecium]HAZ0862803.1 hypothetical protein [Enterococcus faecium]HAZ0866337.1 hypothetical protein [Enterococcus faecium]HAZ0928136.1 hypothetical protein [Enterococcus faecium]HDE0754682.1 hypothetical protein [Enterococcus faecium]